MTKVALSYLTYIWSWPLTFVTYFQKSGKNAKGIIPQRHGISLEWNKTIKQLFHFFGHMAAESALADLSFLFSFHEFICWSLNCTYEQYNIAYILFEVWHLCQCDTKLRLMWQKVSLHHQGTTLGFCNLCAFNFPCKIDIIYWKQTFTHYTTISTQAVRLV